MGKLGFGELELSILNLVRQKGRATVREIYHGLGNQGSYTTIMTVMSRMATKGDLAREKVGKQYVYWLVHSKIPASKNVLKRLHDKIFGGKTAAMISYLLELDQKISEQELDELGALINQRRSKEQK